MSGDVKKEPNLILVKKNNFSLSVISRKIRSRYTLIGLALLILSLSIYSVVVYINFQSNKNNFSKTGNIITTRDFYIKLSNAYGNFDKINGQNQSTSYYNQKAKNEILLNNALLSEAKYSNFKFTQSDIDKYFNSEYQTYGGKDGYYLLYKNTFRWNEEIVNYVNATRFLEDKLNNIIYRDKTYFAVMERWDEPVNENNDPPIIKNLTDNFLPLFKSRLNANEITAATDLAKPENSGKVFADFTIAPTFAQQFDGLNTKADFDKMFAQDPYPNSGVDMYTAVKSLNKVGDYTPITKIQSGFYAIIRLEKIRSGRYNNEEDMLSSYSKKTNYYSNKFTISLGFSLSLKSLINFISKPVLADTTMPSDSGKVQGVACWFYTPGRANSIKVNNVVNYGSYHLAGYNYNFLLNSAPVSGGSLDQQQQWRQGYNCNDILYGANSGFTNPPVKSNSGLGVLYSWGTNTQNTNYSKWNMNGSTGYFEIFRDTQGGTSKVNGVDYPLYNSQFVKNNLTSGSTKLWVNCMAQAGNTGITAPSGYLIKDIKLVIAGNVYGSYNLNNSQSLYTNYNFFKLSNIAGTNGVNNDGNITINLVKQTLKAESSIQVSPTSTNINNPYKVSGSIVLSNSNYTGKNDNIGYVITEIAPNGSTKTILQDSVVNLSNKTVPYSINIPGQNTPGIYKYTVHLTGPSYATIGPDQSAIETISNPTPPPPTATISTSSTPASATAYPGNTVTLTNSVNISGLRGTGNDGYTYTITDTSVGGSLPTSPTGATVSSTTKKYTDGNFDNRYTFTIPSGSKVSKYCRTINITVDTSSIKYATVSSQTSTACVSVYYLTLSCPASISYTDSYNSYNYQYTLTNNGSTIMNVGVNSLSQSPLYLSLSGTFPTSSFDSSSITVSGNSSSTETLTFTNLALGSYNFNINLNDHNGNVLATAACGLRVVIKPYFKVYGGSVMTGSSFIDSSGSCTANSSSNVVAFNYGSGSSTDQAIFAKGFIFGFGSQNNSSRLNNLTFANYGVTLPDNSLGGDYDGITCIPDYFSQFQSSGVDINQIDNSINTSSSDNITYIFNNNDVYINGDITFNTTISNDSAGNPILPTEYIVVKGHNIIIKNSVKEIDAILIAEPNSNGNGGNIYTCTSAPSNTDFGPNGSGNCNTPLTIKGGLIAKQVFLRRATKSISNSSITSINSNSGCESSFNGAEQICSSPLYWLTRPGGILTIKTTNTDYVQQLPPTL